MESMLHTKKAAREGRKRRGKIKDGTNTPYNTVARERRREEERSRMKSTACMMKKKDTYMIVILAVMKKKL